MKDQSAGINFFKIEFRKGKPGDTVGCEAVKMKKEIHKKKRPEVIRGVLILNIGWSL